MSSFSHLGTLLILLYFSTFSWAQSNRIFQWQFTASVSTQLPSCQDLSILVKPFNATGNNGVPPYYMLSFAAGGLPKTDLIGTDPASLKWTVNHPIGTTLMLSVVDSTGGAGGIPPQVYTVVAGQSENCVTKSPPSDFTVTSNVTDTLTTCQPWGIRIKGGVRPYNLTLIANNSPVVTNVTLGSQDDAFTFIDRADPNRQLIAAVSDFTGRWAFGTPIVSTKGSDDVSCVGLVSSSGDAATLERQSREAAAALAAAARKKRSSIIAGVVVSLIVVLALAAGGWYFFIYRRRVSYGDAEKGQDMSVNPFSTPPPSTPTGTTGVPGQVLSITSFISSNSAPNSPKSPNRSSTTFPTASPISSNSSSPISRQTNARSLSSRPSFAAFPRQSTRSSAKAMEAATPPSPGSPNAEPSSEVEGSGAEYVFQHRDGGRVQELPPPYMNPSPTPTPHP